MRQEAGVIRVELLFESNYLADFHIIEVTRHANRRRSVMRQGVGLWLGVYS